MQWTAWPNGVYGNNGGRKCFFLREKTPRIHLLFGEEYGVAGSLVFWFINYFEYSFDAMDANIWMLFENINWRFQNLAS